MTNRAIFISPLNAISGRAYSHRSGEAVMYANMFRETGLDLEIEYSHGLAKDDLHAYNAFDTVIVHPGNDWGGSLNLYGGLSTEAPVLHSAPCPC